MFVVEPEIGEKAWIITVPHMIKDEIFIIHFADIIKEKHIGVYDYTLYNVNNFYVPISRMTYFQFGGITMQNDKFKDDECRMEDDKTIKDFCSKAGKNINVNRIVEPSWWI
jgi:hypothetical protein